MVSYILLFRAVVVDKAREQSQDAGFTLVPTSPSSLGKACTSLRKGSIRATGWRNRCTKTANCCPCIKEPFWNSSFLIFQKRFTEPVEVLRLLPLFIYHVPLRHPRLGVLAFPRKVPHSKATSHIINARSSLTMDHAHFTIDDFSTHITASYHLSSMSLFLARG